ncbi:LamG-like jellyroll fold domain-containing protein, partial [Marinobacter sp.]|uniref:LamG-like jellyroll fold domain-containing protein n=1 Tax=Marinobacter sp. TaxID=50741 RepID=UPI000C93ABED
MTSIGSPSPFFFGGKKAHEVERSLRFSYGDSANLTRTSSSASTTFTYSAWVKRARIGEYQSIFSMGVQAFTFHTNYHTLILYDGSTLHQSARVFRDPSAWYHIVVQINSGVATSYVNNVLVHNAVGSGFTLTTGTNETRVGSQVNTYYFNGYQAEINFVDGSVLAPSSFAETDAITGQWNPKKYVGSYGTNGFYLNFSDNSGTTATTLGKDSSGNGNNFTPNNFGATAHDQVKDTPTNNFATWNPISTRSLPTLSEGNLKNASDNNSACNSTFGVTSGKWYWEIHILTDISTTSYIAATGVTAYQTELEGDSVPRLNYDTSKRSWYRAVNTSGAYSYKNYTDTNGTDVNSGGTFYGGTVISFRLDMDNGTLKYYTNNTLVHTDSTIPTDGTVIFPMQNATNSGTSRHNSSIINFGQDGTFAGNKTAQGNADENGIGNFFYAVPSGHKAMCSANLPDPTIKLPNKHF